MGKPEIILVTPALADANNGNWRTAQRWARMLRNDYRVCLVPDWSAADQATAGAATPVAMIALHARKSAAAARAWRQAYPDRPLIVVLTGTDLYRDISTDAAAQQSLDIAEHLLVLNELGLLGLPERVRHKATVCLQSSPTRAPAVKAKRHLRALMVGHLREEKSPQTFMDAAMQLTGRSDIHLDHIGAALNPALGAAAQACMRHCPRYRWLGEMPYAPVRQHIQRAHVLVHTSRIEGGAQVVIEAITSGTPVLVSRIDGNLGLLGVGYDGSFEVGDSAGLAALLTRCRDDPAMLPQLHAQCARRAHLFDPAHERQTLLDVLTAQLA